MGPRVEAYDMPWMGLGDAENGRDPILGSFTGQIILAKSEAHKELKIDTQNHTIIYYDSMAASTLGDIWKDVNKPDTGAAFYREGSLVVKAGGVAATPSSGRNRMARRFGASIARRSARSSQTAPRGGAASGKLVVQNLRVMQFDIIVKDSEAAPETGWVFATFVYDKSAPKGTRTLGSVRSARRNLGQNDPEADGYYPGHPPVDPSNPHAPLLKQFWRIRTPEYTQRLSDGAAACRVESTSPSGMEFCWSKMCRAAASQPTPIARSCPTLR